MTTWIIIAVASLLLSALFSGVEIAYVSADKVRVELDQQKGGVIGSILGQFYGRSDFFLSSLLVGNNIVLVIYGMAVAKLLEPTIEGWFPQSEAMTLLCQTLISTLVIIFMGEFLPKSLFRINPNTSLRLAALPIYLFYLLLYPVSYFTSGLSRLLMKLVGIRRPDAVSGTLSVVELNDYIERSMEQTPASADEPQQQIENEVKIFHNAIDFSQTHVRDCMIPRNEIVAVDIDTTSRAELSRLFTQSGRSKIIVYRTDIDSVLGYIHVSELLHVDADWRQCLKPVIFAPETLMANKMMRRLLAEKRSVALVVDEFGGTSGMVTLEDLVEEILGDIQDEHDRSTLVARKLSDGAYEFSGRAEVELLREQYGIDIPESDEYQTLAGYLLRATGTIPAEGTTLEIEPYTFRVLKSAANKLELIRIEHSKSC
jgi:CBS domain containing-hemolysin-like protein